MTAEPATQECVIYVEGACITGTLRTQHRRLSDAFNAAKDPVMKVWDARVVELGEVAPIPQAAEFVIIRVHDVVVCHPPAGSNEAHSQSDSSILRAARTLHPVAVCVAGFAMTGEAHIPPGTDLFEYITARFDPFLPMTNVTLDGVESKVQLPFVLVNSQKISVIYEIAQEAPAVEPPAETSEPAVEEKRPRGALTSWAERRREPNA